MQQEITGNCEAPEQTENSWEELSSLGWSNSARQTASITSYRSSMICFRAARPCNSNDLSVVRVKKYFLFFAADFFSHEMIPARWFSFIFSHRWHAIHSLGFTPDLLCSLIKCVILRIFLDLKGLQVLRNDIFHDFRKAKVNSVYL